MIVRMLRVLTAGLIFVYAAGAQAQAQDPKLWYVALGAGAAWYDSLPVTGAGGTGNVNMEQPGFNVSGAFGRYLDDIKVIRLEGEVLFTRSDISNIDATGAGGNLSNVGLMVNAFYDINTNSNWTPYLGGGLGYSRVTFDNLSAGGVTLIDDSADAFSWQFKAGVSYQFNPSISMNVAYRYYATDNLAFKDAAGAPVTSGGTRTHNAEVGVRFHF